MNVLQEGVCRNRNALADVSKNGNDGGEAPVKSSFDPTNDGAYAACESPRTEILFRTNPSSHPSTKISHAIFQTARNVFRLQSL